MVDGLRPRPRDRSVDGVAIDDIERVVGRDDVVTGRGQVTVEIATPKPQVADATAAIASDMPAASTPPASTTSQVTPKSE